MRNKLCDHSWLLSSCQLPELADLEAELDHGGQHLLGGPGHLVLVAAVAVHVHPHRGSTGPGA